MKQLEYFNKTLKWREQLNDVTPWLDSSQIYGSFLCKAKNLRSENSGGKLNVLPHPMNPDVFKPLLPRIATNHECLSPTGLCYSAGDDRSNEQFSLTVMHTIWVRHHNFIAEQLSIINPHWNDEKLYQEARKIIIAQIQHITYNEYLPKVLGEDLMELYDLKLSESLHQKIIGISFILILLSNIVFVQTCIYGFSTINNSFHLQ